MDVKLPGLVDMGSWFSIVLYSFEGWIGLNIWTLVLVVSFIDHPKSTCSSLFTSYPEWCLRDFLRLASISCGSKFTGIGYDSCYISVNSVLSDLQSQRR
jgi:hypothetical protein